ncbi:MAG: type II secretion system F family protein [Anaerolineae bacterium]|jgi:tight adherence protein B
MINARTMTRSARWIWLLWPVLWASLLAGCGEAMDLPPSRLDVSLTAAQLPGGARGPVLRVLVVARDAAGRPVLDLQMRAALIDAGGVEMADLACSPVAQSPGTYQSEAYVPPPDAEAGGWTVAVTAQKGDTVTERRATVQVAPLFAGEASTAVAVDAASQSGLSAAAPVDSGGPLLFGLLIFLAVLVIFFGLWRTLSAIDPLEARIKELGMDRDAVMGQTTAATRLTPAQRLLNGLGLGPRLAETLRRADAPFTAVEFALMMIGAALAGFLLGTLRAGVLAGLALGGVTGYLPLVYLKSLESRRKRIFTEQLPDVLTLMVGALRAGYGLTQTLQELVNQMPPPASTEFARVMRAIGLGVSVQQALRDMSERIGTDDVELMVTAVTVQFETGGNLAETLETIGETIRDRVRILGEIRTFTAQQRLTGYVLAALPLGLFGLIFMMNPSFFRPFFEPGWPRMLPFIALGLQFIGFILIRRIVDIEV